MLMHRWCFNDSTASNIESQGRFNQILLMQITPKYAFSISMHAHTHTHTRALAQDQSDHVYPSDSAHVSLHPNSTT